MRKDWVSDDVIANGIKIHYYRTGGDKPAAVLAHGITDNGLCWTQLAQLLERDYDVIMYDARGHGRSNAPEDDYADVTQANDLADLIRALDLDKPSLIGHSLGAITASVTAANFPDLVRCAILEDPPWLSGTLEVSAEERAVGAEGWRAQILETKALSREEIIAKCRAENPRWTDAECGPWADSKRQVNLSVFKLMATPWTPWQQVVRRISCPILLITGDPALGAIVTHETAQEACALWQSGSVVRIGGAGHCIRREAPERYFQAVTAFLKQEDEGAAV